MEPLQVLAGRGGGPAPTPATAGGPRAVPLVAAASAVLIAGVSGALVTAGGDPHASASLVSPPRPRPPRRRRPWS